VCYTQPTVKVKFTLYPAIKAQRISRGIPLPLLSPRQTEGDWITPLPGRFTSGNDSVQIV